MKSVIIEDEKQSAEHLDRILKSSFPQIEVIAKLRSVEESIEWFNENEHPELIFMDIELSDGTCFDLLEEVDIQSQLLFTTAYDQHALKAFEYNSIAYLLKPITETKLKDALSKVKTMYIDRDNSSIINELTKFLKHEYKKRFLVKRGDSFWHIAIDKIAYFVSEDGLTVGYLFDKRKFFIDHTLDDLEKIINPSDFFRINRKTILNINSIVTVKTYFARRLLLEVEPKPSEDIIVSRERSAKFKSWLSE